VFTELLLDTRSPAAAVAVDPAAAQIDYARSQRVAQRADFRVSDAQMLPFISHIEIIIFDNYNRAYDTTSIAD
jgi:hypothetical protein